MKKITKSILYILLAVAIMIPMGSAFASPDDADDAFPSLSGVPLHLASVGSVQHKRAGY